MRLSCLGLIMLLATTASAQEIKPRDPDELRKEPIVSGNGDLEKRLKSWWDEGTAAGNVGDWYDNRDGEHSPLDLKPWPQLQKIHYTEEMLKARVNWAAQRQVLPVVVFGNSSTSAPATSTGSNPRTYYLSTQGMGLLEQHYAKNNLYIYPEHRDHDPGKNGRGPLVGGNYEEGYGDLYPTNTPYLIISQGSSGSDQPFMRAMPYLLASFRPEVKKKLVNSGTLMPTIQMIFRASNKHLKEGDYLTGKAHPSVFEGSWVDPVKMAIMAHDLTLQKLPPRVSIKAADETEPKVGLDFFDPVKGEKLADTSAVIARIFRGKDRWRTMTVSAEDSEDLGGKPLTFEWKVLRGDPAGVVITPKNDAKSIVEIKVAHPERRPIAPGSPIESSRVDIGVFAKSDGPWSAPAFVTWYGLENERRTYDKDRLVEIAYGSGETRAWVRDWKKLLASPHAGLLGKLTEEQAAALKKLEEEKAAFEASVDPAADAKATEKARRELDEKQTRKRTEVLGPAQGVRLQKLVSDLTVGLGVPFELDGAQEAAIKAARKRVRPLMTAEKSKTAFDQELEEQVAGETLRQIFGDAISVDRQVNFVDPRLTLTRSWRDVYRYDPAGKFIGWTRYGGEKPADFTADGHVVDERDEKGRCRIAKEVVYRVEGKGKGVRGEVHWAPGTQIVEYTYVNDDDLRGRAKLVEKNE